MKSPSLKWAKDVNICVTKDIEMENKQRKMIPIICHTVQLSRSVVSDSLRSHELQHARPPCPSPTPRVHSNSHPSSQWCHPAISSSVVPFSSCPQSLPASVFSNESTLHIRWPKYWSFSFSIIPSKEHPGLISLQSMGLPRVFSNIKELQITPNAGRGVEQQEWSFTATRNVKCYGYFGRQWAILTKLNMLLWWSSNSIPWYLTKRVKNLCTHTHTHTNLCTNVSRNFIQNCPNLEVVRMPLSQ